MGVGRSRSVSFSYEEACKRGKATYLSATCNDSECLVEMFRLPNNKLAQAVNTCITYTLATSIVSHLYFKLLLI